MDCRPLSILLTGDLLLDEPDAGHWLSDIAPALRAADLAIGHLEVPHTRRGAELAGDVPAPGAPPENLEALADAGFGAVSLAGNHIADCGAEGISDTRAGLAALGIAFTGAGRDLAEASEVALVRVQGSTVALLSYNCVGPEAAWAGADRAGCNYLRVEVAASKPGNFDDKPWFAHLNSSKRSVSLDLKQPASCEVLDPLIDWADVVVENFSPGTMAKLGLDYDTLAARNSGVIMVSGGVFGQTGPLAQEWGVDGTGGALSGRTYLTGWPERDPVIPGAVPYGDVIVPYVMAACVAAALQHRRETGRGCHIDASMSEICVKQMRDALAAAKRGERPQRMGNADAGVYFQDVFPALGNDRWVAISLFSAEERERLEVITGPDIVAWTGTREDHAIAAELQAAGIACGVLQDCEDLFDRDPLIAEREALVVLDHPYLGSFGHIATPLRFSRDAMQPYRAPGMGEHAAEVAHEISGLSEARIAELTTAGVFK